MNRNSRWLRTMITKWVDGYNYSKKLIVANLYTDWLVSVSVTRVCAELQHSRNRTMALLFCSNVDLIRCTRYTTTDADFLPRTLRIISRIRLTEAVYKSRRMFEFQRCIFHRFSFIRFVQCARAVFNWELQQSRTNLAILKYCCCIFEKSINNKNPWDNIHSLFKTAELFVKLLRIKLKPTDHVMPSITYIFFFSRKKYNF